MKIVEQNEQRMVITPSVGDLAIGRTARKTLILGMFILSFLAVAVGLLIGSLLGNYNSPIWEAIVPCLLISFALLLYTLGEISGKRTVIDKTAESIIFTRRLFMLITRKQVIPFSQVRKIRTEYNVYSRYKGGEFSAYDVSIELPGALKVKTVSKCPKCGYESSSWRVSCLSCGAVMNQITNQDYKPKTVMVFQTAERVNALNAGGAISNLIGVDTYYRVQDG